MGINDVTVEWVYITRYYSWISGS